MWCRFSICLILIPKLILAVTHDILQELLDTPAVPSPSLRSQLKEVTRDYRGRVILSAGTQFCPNSIVNYDPKMDVKVTEDSVRSIFHGPPPKDVISIIAAVGQLSANAFIQGVPLVLFDQQVPRRWLGILSVVVIHPSSATVIRHYRHPTYYSAQLLKSFIESIQPGRIILIAGYTRYMAEDMREYLTKLGIYLPDIYGLKQMKNEQPGNPMLMMSWVRYSGGNIVGGTSRVWRPVVKQGIFYEIQVPKSKDSVWCNGNSLIEDSTDTTWLARKELCQTYDGYGPFCSCSNLPLSDNSDKNQRNFIMSKTVAVVMASRPTSLHRLLASLLETGGILKENILVFTNQQYAPELTLVCKSHGVSLDWTGRASDCETLHRTRLYESGLSAAVILRPKAQFFLVLEDDMEVERNLFRWLSKARQILRYDDRFICVNTIAVPGKNYTTESYGNNSNLLKGEKFLPGFALNRNVLEALLRFWPLSTHDLAWESMLDYWAGDSPCLAPERSYARHVTASFYTLGGDISPTMPEESKRPDHLLRPYMLKG